MSAIFTPSRGRFAAGRPFPSERRTTRDLCCRSRMDSTRLESKTTMMFALTARRGTRFIGDGAFDGFCSAQARSAPESYFDSRNAATEQ